MDKNGLLASLTALPWCGGIVGETLHETKSDGTAWCGVTYHEIDAENNTMSVRNANFYVQNPGTPNESAYWQNDVPTPTLATNRAPVATFRMVTFRTMIDALGPEIAGSIIAKLKAAAMQNVVLEQAYRMLETYGVDGGIDINSTGTQDTIRGLGAMGVLSTDEVAAVLSLAE
jgi:hypothetical protein